MAEIQLHHLQPIVNVAWAGGLAVEFGNRAEDAPKPPKPSEEAIDE